ncbi:cytochrome c biogenesis CcdA family protein [Thermodesulfobacteriota bacterium]
MFVDTIPYSAAFLAGLLSFFSPCILPLIPAYFTFITGFSIDELTRDTPKGFRQKVFLSTVFYVLGFSFVFILLGASASYLGGVITENKDLIRMIGGVIIVVLGIHLTGIVRIRGLYFEKRIHLAEKPLHFFGTFVIGMAFGAGWSPCIGPLLGSILLIAGSQETVRQGMLLLAVYSAGLAMPFIIISIFINFMLEFLKKAARAMQYLNSAAGILLILIGVLLLTNRLFFLS